MTSFANQGTSANSKPHLLTAYINGWGGVTWKIECPHEGPRDCGTLEECHGTPEQMKTYGCSPRPVPPSDTMPVEWGYFKADNDAKDVWNTYYNALEQWRTSHEGREHHRTEKCWFELALEEDWFDSEEYLDLIPEGTRIVSPLRVLVGHDGYDEDTTPKFKIWEENGDADS
jgi:hypothetical protein